jgi:hypothetical protein
MRQALSGGRMGGAGTPQVWLPGIVEWTGGGNACEKLPKTVETPSVS